MRRVPTSHDGPDPSLAIDEVDLRKAVYLGGSVEYTLDTGVGELFAVSLDVAHPRAAGSAVSVALAAHGVVVIPEKASG